MAHTDIQTTIKFYGHLQPNVARDVIEQFAQIHTPDERAPTDDAPPAREGVQG
jgi:uncharacterized pyridoxal phosphate-containing UPF0001 family protein